MTRLAWLVAGAAVCVAVSARYRAVDATAARDRALAELAAARHTIAERNAEAAAWEAEADHWRAVAARLSHPSHPPQEPTP